MRVVTGSYQITYAMIQFRADGWLDKEYECELTQYYTDDRPFRLMLVSNLPIPLAKMIRKIGRHASRWRKLAKQVVFNLKGI